jgi:hypothetical protein
VTGWRWVFASAAEFSNPLALAREGTPLGLSAKAEHRLAAAEVALIVAEIWFSPTTSGTEAALILAGAVAKGAFHAGAISVLAEREVAVTRIVATSDGALNAAVLAAGIATGRVVHAALPKAVVHPAAIFPEAFLSQPRQSAWISPGVPRCRRSKELPRTPSRARKSPGRPSFEDKSP